MAEPAERPLRSKEEEGVPLPAGAKLGSPGSPASLSQEPSAAAGGQGTGAPSDALHPTTPTTAAAGPAARGAPPSSAHPTAGVASPGGAAGLPPAVYLAMSAGCLVLSLLLLAAPGLVRRREGVKVPEKASWNSALRQAASCHCTWQHKAHAQAW